MYGETPTGFLNRLLYDELRKVSPGAEAFLFEDVSDAIEHFARVTGVKADELPPPEQREEIKREAREEETLPPGQQVYGLPDYRPSSLAALGLHPRSARGALLSGEGGLSWSQIISHEPPKEDG
jgi:hypothetical protein